MSERSEAEKHIINLVDEVSSASEYILKASRNLKEALLKYEHLKTEEWWGEAFETSDFYDKLLSNDQRSEEKHTPVNGRCTKYCTDDGKKACPTGVMVSLDTGAKKIEVCVHPCDEEDFLAYVLTKGVITSIPVVAEPTAELIWTKINYKTGN